MPMRFADLDGTLIDVYQAVTQITDESQQSQPYTIDTLLDRALGPDQHFGVITVNAHTDPGGHEAGVGEAVIASAIERNVPIVTRARCSTGSTRATTRASDRWPGTVTQLTSRSSGHRRQRPHGADSGAFRHRRARQPHAQRPAGHLRAGLAQGPGLRRVRRRRRAATWRPMSPTQRRRPSWRRCRPAVPRMCRARGRLGDVQRVDGSGHDQRRLDVRVA